MGDPFQDTEEDEPEPHQEQLQEFDFLGFTQEDLQSSTYKQLLEEMESTNCSSLEQLTQEWAKMDEDVPTAEIHTDEEIVEEITSQQDQDQEQDEEEPEEDQVPISDLIKSAEQLVAHFHKTGQTLLWIQQQTILRSLRLELERKRKQVKLNDLFKSM